MWFTETLAKQNFNPRSPHGERHSLRPPDKSTQRISIHAPRMGSDFFCLISYSSIYSFQSTLPAWGATFFVIHFCFLTYISIHAPRMGSDHETVYPPCVSAYFNPRSPHGERHESWLSLGRLVLFQSTLPAWGATVVE